MARIADKHGLTNPYREKGHKRHVKRGRPKKLLFKCSKKSRRISQTEYNLRITGLKVILYFLLALLIIVLFALSIIEPSMRLILPVFIGIPLFLCVNFIFCKVFSKYEEIRIFSVPYTIWTFFNIPAFIGGLASVLDGSAKLCKLIILGIVYASISAIILYKRVQKLKKF